MITHVLITLQTPESEFTPVVRDHLSCETTTAFLAGCLFTTDLNSISLVSRVLRKWSAIPQLSSTISQLSQWTCSQPAAGPFYLQILYLETYVPCWETVKTVGPTYCKNCEESKPELFNHPGTVTHFLITLQTPESEFTPVVRDHLSCETTTAFLAGCLFTTGLISISLVKRVLRKWSAIIEFCRAFLLLIVN